MFTKELYSSLLNDNEDPLGDALDRASTLYNKILEQGGMNGDHDVWGSGSVEDMTTEGVTIEWELTWRYGGEDSGSYFVPADALFDDTWEEVVTTLANEVVSKKKAKTMAKAEREAKFRLAEYERLKKEFGDE